MFEGALYPMEPPGCGVNGRLVFDTADSLCVYASDKLLDAQLIT
jgi:hypothetical protein